MNTSYLVRRLAWRWFPGLLNWRKKHLQNLPLPRGMETRFPQEAVDRYLIALHETGVFIQDQRILILGSGGNFAVGCKLLALGAAHVTLCDPYAKPEQSTNQQLLPEYRTYLRQHNGQILPRSEYLTFFATNVHQLVRQVSLEPVDLVLSSSVFEHIEDVEGTVKALSCLSQGNGVALHFIDLRDHLYRYPFEMLCYSSFIWKYWLNPGSHLNRWRVWNYRQVFSRYYAQVKISIEKQDEPAFQQAAPHIRPEFTSGNLPEDSATFIKVIARSPLPEKGADSVSA